MKLQTNNIYYHNGAINNGRITCIKEKEDWRDLGFPYMIFDEMIRT